MSAPLPGEQCTQRWLRSGAVTLLPAIFRALLPKGSSVLRSPASHAAFRALGELQCGWIPTETPKTMTSRGSCLLHTVVLPWASHCAGCYLSVTRRRLRSGWCEDSQANRATQVET